MAELTRDIFYFDDLSVHVFRSMTELLLESESSSLLPFFMSSTFTALRAEVEQLPGSERDLFAGNDFRDILNNIQDRNVHHFAINSVLSCLLQLGWAVRSREQDKDAWLRPDRTIAFSGMGSLPAIATAVARSDSDLLELAPKFVLISLRLGLEIARRSSVLEATSDSWSTAISGLDLATIKTELQAFNNVQDISSLKQIYISSYSSTSFTLSGPPTLLQKFLSSVALKPGRQTVLPIYGAVHAAHLPVPDIDCFLANLPFLERRVEFALPLLVPRPEPAMTLGEILRETLIATLHETHCVDDMIQQTISRTCDHHVQLNAIGPADIRILEQALEPGRVYHLGSGQTDPHLADNALAGANIGEAVAVIGMAGRFPGADNVDQLWDIIVQGRDMHRKIPNDRFNVDTHYDPTGKVQNTSLTPYGCFYDGIGDFDTSLFKMSPREAAQTDPMQRMMLLTAYEALESAGYYDQGDFAPRPRNGTFYGCGADDYRQANASQKIDTNYITGGTRAFGPGRVSYHFGWEGMSMSIDAACSASAVAMHQAISSLRLGECDIALAGGTNLLTCSDMFAGLSRAKFVCTTGSCKTFDEKADGYCRADGAATVVFKRLTDAIRDKDCIHGVIRSIETNHAGTAISLTHPEDETQTALFRKVLSKAGLTVDDIDHIELHGTGTQAGDLAESKSVTNLLDRPRPKHRPLTISSVKPNVGHSEAASGVTSLIKALLMIRHQTIPSHIGIKTRLNPKLPSFEALNVIVPMENMPYPAPDDKPRRMLVNNFNATGGITAMLLEEHKPVLDQIFVDPRDEFPIVVSAATTTTLKKSLSRLLKHLKTHTKLHLAHLSYTLTARRIHHKHRFACVVNSIEDLQAKIQAEIAVPLFTGKQAQRVFCVFLFTGSTSVLPQAKLLFDTNKMFRSHICQYDRLSRDMGLPSLKDVVNGENIQPRPCQLQLALVALEIALAQLFQSWGILPSAVIGHSLGEYAALCISSTLSLADTLWLVGKRGMLLEYQCDVKKFAMAVVALPADSVAALLGDDFCYEIACFNSSEQTVVTGKDTDMDTLISQLRFKGVKATKLSVPYGFHSKQMDAILDDYRKIAAGVQFNRPKIPMASTLLGKIIIAQDAIDADYLCHQTRQPVQFQNALDALEKQREADQIILWIELGPTSACLPMIASTLRTNSRDMIASLMPNKSNWSTIAAVIAKYYASGGTVRWDEYHREYLDSLQLLQLPSYPFDMKRCWIQYDGDWMIRKNQKPQSSKAIDLLPAEIKIDSSTLHHLEGDETENGARKLIFTTNVSQLHVKSGSNMLESMNLILAEMSMSAAAHLWKLSGESSSAAQVSNMEIYPPGVLSIDTVLRTEATQLTTAHSTIDVVIMSVNKVKVPYSRCTVSSNHHQALAAETESESYLYQSRMDLMQLFVANGQASCLSKYEASKFLSREQSSYAIDNLIVSLDYREAVATFQLPLSKSDYICDPELLWLLVQLPTALANSALSSTYKCTGWKRLHFLTALETGNTYRAHARLQLPVISGTQVGDIHILDYSGQIVAIMKQLLLQPESNNSSIQSSQPSATAPINVARPQPVTEILTFPLQQHNIERKKSTTRITSTNSLLPSNLRSFADDSDEHAIITTTTNSGDLEQESSATSSSPTIKELDFNVILNVLSTEIGVEIDSLTDDVELEDLGVDSIMQISIVSRLQELVPHPLPPGFMIKYNSILKIRQYLETLWSALSRSSFCDFHFNPSRDTLTHSPLPAARQSFISRPSNHIDPVMVSETRLEKTQNPFQILTRSNRVFEAASHKHGFAKYWSYVAPLQDEIFFAYINEAFIALGVDMSKEPHGIEIPSVPHIAKYNRLHERLLEFLESRYVVFQRGGKVLRGSDGIVSTSASQLCDHLRSRYPSFRSEAALMSLVGPYLADCLGGKIDPISVLFGNVASREIVEEFYSRSPMMETHIKQLIFFMIDLLRSRKPDTSTPVHILEVGGGTGGTTARILDALSEAKIPALYTFTDIGSSFVARAKTRWSSILWMDFQVLDIEQDIPQDFQRKFDIVIGANVVHATSDRIAACRRLRETLRPNGILLLSEITHVINWYDMCFGLLDGWWLAEGGKEYPIQPASVWMDAFDQAGFRNFAHSGGDTEESNTQQLLLGSVQDYGIV